MSYAIRQKNRLRTLIIARLFIVTFLLFSAQYLFNIDMLLIYSVIAVVAVLSILYLFWWLLGKYLVLLTYIQIAFDLILESFLVYYTGGIDSMFVTIYVLSILSAGFVLHPESSFIVAVMSSLAFVASMMANQKHLALHQIVLFVPNFASPHESIYLFYAVYVWLTVFFLVALLSYYFTKNIRRLELQVKNQERLVFLGEVVSTIAHEIRNPLTSISGSVELLAHQLAKGLNLRQAELMKAVVDESSRINRIFSELLDYAGFPKLKMDQIDFESFLDQLLLLAEHQPGFSLNVKVDKRYKGKKYKIRADSEYLKQAFMNIIMNAFQAMPQGGKLVLDYYKKQADLIVLIRDSGVGMDAKTLSSIFIPFNSTKEGGTGLGMPQANKIISLHNGKIKVESKINEGTSFEVLLPTGE